MQQNSPDIQTLIKDLNDLIYKRKVSLAEAYNITTVNSESKIQIKTLEGSYKSYESSNCFLEKIVSNF